MSLHFPTFASSVFVNTIYSQFDRHPEESPFIRPAAILLTTRTVDALISSPNPIQSINNAIARLKSLFSPELQAFERLVDYVFNQHKNDYLKNNPTHKDIWNLDLAKTYASLYNQSIHQALELSKQHCIICLRFNHIVATSEGLRLYLDLCKTCQKVFYCFRDSNCKSIHTQSCLNTVFPPLLDS